MAKLKGEGDTEILAALPERETLPQYVTTLLVEATKPTSSCSCC